MIDKVWWVSWHKRQLRNVLNAQNWGPGKGIPIIRIRWLWYNRNIYTYIYWQTVFILTQGLLASLNTKIPLYRCRKPPLLRENRKMVSQQSYVYDGNPHTWNECLFIEMGPWGKFEYKDSVVLMEETPIVEGRQTWDHLYYGISKTSKIAYLYWKSPQFVQLYFSLKYQSQHYVNLHMNFMTP